MDREALRNQAALRRNAVETTEVKQKVKWDCTYCTRSFAGERAFMNHKCKERERIEELRSPIGQAAYLYYSQWLSAKKRSVPDIETFAHSQFYTTFIKFATHVSRVHVPNVKLFIKLMVDNGDVSPGLWCRDNVYAMYLEWYDKAYEPEIQFVDSLDFLKSLALDYECEIGAIFGAVGWQKLEELIRRRKLSPWFLLSSKVFRAYVNSLAPLEKDAIERSMNAGAMIARIQQRTDLFKMFNAAATAEGL